jgi:spore germination protein YaaH
MLRGKRPDEHVRGRIRKLAGRTAGIVAGAALLLSTLSPIARVEAQVYHMSYLYFGTPDTIEKNVKKTNGALDMVSPSFFDVDEDGSLLMSALFSPDLVRRLHAQGVKVVPFLSNHWDRKRGERALNRASDLADEIVRAVAQYDLDGVNVDIENVSEVYREKYTNFVRILRERLPDDKEVSVAVAANPNGWRDGWHGSYDYKALAEAADYLMLMAYDQSFQGGLEGPVAALPWVERSIQYALNQGVPPEKLVLGLAFYGRYWLQGSADPAHRGMGVSNAKVAELIARYGGTVAFDETTASPKAVFTIKPGDASTEVFGTVLPAGTYHVYFENNESLRRKAELVERYGLKGTGSWSLGQEEASLWDEFGAWFAVDPADGSGAGEPAAPDPAALPFRDIPASHWARADIAAVYAEGWMQGRSATVFAPEATLTRAEAATIFVRMLGLAGRDEGTAKAPFGDVPAGHWAAGAIAAAHAEGLVAGTGGGKFSPDAPITREQMAALLQRAVTRQQTGADTGGATDPSVAGAAGAGTAAAASAGSDSAAGTAITGAVAAAAAPPNAARRFPDVAGDRWSYAAVTQAAEWGVLRGYGDGTFRPEHPVTRAETAAILLRVFALLGGGLPSDGPPNSGSVADELIGYGMRGEAVADLQALLAALGYFDHEVTGYFGEITLSAVRRFQQDQGLAVDGIVGPETRRALRETAEKHIAANRAT